MESAQTFSPEVLVAEPAKELRWLGKLWIPAIFDGEHYFEIEATETGSRLVNGERFRMLNERGDPQFSGYILGEFAGGEPLEDYGAENGCSAIQYDWDGEWISVEEFARRRASGEQPR